MSAAPTSWRDRIAVHPAAALFPMMSHAELLELGRDIRDNELRQPVVLWTPERAEDVSRSGPKENYLLDGRNRLEAVELVFADDDDRRELIEAMLYRQPTNPVGPVQLYSHDDPYAYVVSANVRRRHLNTEKKREVIAALLRENPERSDRATAEVAKVDHKTVAAVRVEVEGRGEIPHVEARLDTVGREQPAHRPPPAAVVHRSSLPPPPSKEEQIRQLRERSAEGSAQSHDHLHGRDPADFTAATALLGLLHHIARTSENIDIAAALRGLSAAEFKDARDAVAVVRGWVAKADALLWGAQ